MAIAPGSYSFMGGAVLGKGSEGQFVLVRSGSLLTAFTDDEYNACLEAVHYGKAVCVQYKIGPVTFQTQLLNVTGPGDLQFVDSSVQSVTHYRVAGTSPHTVSIVKTGSAQQFVLERDDMSTAFTASEYLQCQTRISEGTALCVQWKSGSARMQAQLSGTLADGSLLFSLTTVDLETIFIVAGSDPHNITAHTNSLGCKVEIFNCTEPYWPNPTEMFDSYNDGKDVVIVRQSLSGVIYSVWRLANVVEDLGLVTNYTLEFQNEDGDTTASHKTKRVKFHSTDYENWTTTEKTFYYPERKTIAPNWNALDVSNYKKGTLVYRAGVLYRCKTNSPSGSWVD